MCEWCNENGGEPISCQDCGKLLCWDMKSGDDIMGRPYVTASGDVFCVSCGQEIDRIDEEEDVYDTDYDYDDDEEFDEVMDMDDDGEP